MGYIPIPASLPVYPGGVRVRWSSHRCGIPYFTLEYDIKAVVESVNSQHKLVCLETMMLIIHTHWFRIV